MPTPVVNGDFTITVLKAGQADAIVIKTENSCIVIDCGEKDDGNKVLEYLDENNIISIGCLIITHFDKDHVGGAAKILKKTTVDKILVPDYEGSNSEYSDYLKALDKTGLSQTVLTEEASFMLDDVLFNVYPPRKSNYSTSDNDFSLVVSASYGNLKFLFAGDAESERIAELMEQLDGSYYLLKVPHHGRFNTKTYEFFKFIAPSVSVITDSEKNPADNRTIASLKAVGSEVYCTKDGTVTVISDGNEATVIQ